LIALAAAQRQNWLNIWLAEPGIEPSLGSKGDSYDNALAETINGLYKAKVIHRKEPRKPGEAVELATLEGLHGLIMRHL
jgi:transposase InsO family protein